MFPALSFIFATYFIVIIVALIIRKKNQLPWCIFFLFNIAASISYIILSLTILEDVIRVPAFQYNTPINLLDPTDTHFSILAICLLGIINAFISLALFVFFIFRDIKEF